MNQPDAIEGAPSDQAGFQEAVPVVAAVISRGDHFLVCQRPYDKRHGGKWEFPGGKRLPEETVEQAVARELREELNVEVRRVHAAMHEVSDLGSPFVITFYPVDIEGEPERLEHLAVAWVSRLALLGLALAPSDARFVGEVLAKV